MSVRERARAREREKELVGMCARVGVFTQAARARERELVRQTAGETHANRRQQTHAGREGGRE